MGAPKQKDRKVGITYHGHNAAITALSWSPSGKQIASASDDKVVDIWFPGERRRIMSYHGHQDCLWRRGPACAGLAFAQQKIAA